MLLHLNLKPLSQFARTLYNTLRSDFFLTSHKHSHTLLDVSQRCNGFSGGIKSLQNSGHANYSAAIECDPDYRNATHEH